MNLFIPKYLWIAGSGQNRILQSLYDQAVDLNSGCDQNVWFDNTFTLVNQPCIQ